MLENRPINLEDLEDMGSDLSAPEISIWERFKLNRGILALLDKTPIASSCNSGSSDGPCNECVLACGSPQGQ